MKAKIKLLFSFFSIALIFACIEEIPLETQTEFDEVLVVEGTITDELKHQIIKLSKSYELESNDPSSASNAIITVTDDIGNTYTFDEVENGIYQSDLAFAAQPNYNYKLKIINENTTYNSDQVSFIAPTQIDSLYFERGFNENDQEGISVFVDTFNPEGSSNYYRYTYEETYKIIAPRYSPLKLIDLDAELPVLASQFSDIQEIQDYFVELVPRDENVSICYNTVKSNTVITTDTNDFPEDRLDKYRVRFLSRINPIIRHRYSIIVTQYVQSFEAFNYYNALKSFSLSENVFSENQLGFLEGNISADNNSKKVVGFFEVSSVDSKRIYFNFVDQFPNEDLPPYFTRCDDEIYPELYKFDPLTQEIIESFLVNSLRTGYLFTGENTGENPNFIPVEFFPFILVTEPCGDCTVLGSTAIPDFWEE